MGLCRELGAAIALVLLVGCGEKKNGDADANGPADAACDNLGCFVVDCGAKGLPPTTLTGTVYAPNGTLPLYGVNVYVPASDPGPLTEGVTCDRCSAGLQGGALAATLTDEAGNFRLENVPATAEVPIVVQTGKWRRQFKVPLVAACQDNATEKAQTTLPKDKTEGDLPRIAITTGNADALECLVRKMGISDTEFGTAGDDRRVHLYFGNGANQFRAGFAGGSGNFANAKSMWDSVATLSAYDLVLFSCEGDQRINTAPGVSDKPQTSIQAVHDYAGLGGRVFMSHWHNVWISGDRTNPTNPNYGMADWKAIFNWNFGAAQTDVNTQITTVDESTVPVPGVIGGLPNPKGTSFATWLMNVGASTTRNEVPVNSPRYTAPSIANPPQAERWVYVDPARSVVNGQSSVQDALFTTPVDLPTDQRCGKVVFSDMHVSAGGTSASISSSGVPFPGTGINGDAQKGCDVGDLSAQEKALAFIFFDIATCVGVLQ